jgi:hypothetical protein
MARNDEYGRRKHQQRLGESAWSVVKEGYVRYDLVILLEKSENRILLSQWLRASSLVGPFHDLRSLPCICLVFTICQVMVLLHLSNGSTNLLARSA